MVATSLENAYVQRQMRSKAGEHSAVIACLELERRTLVLMMLRED